MTDERVSPEALQNYAKYYRDDDFGKVCHELLANRAELDWERNVVAEHGYDGPQGDGCSPLREWLREWQTQKAELLALREQAGDYDLPIGKLDTVSVPKDPTGEQQQAGYERWMQEEENEQHGGRSSIQMKATAIYKAMYAAAPRQPEARPVEPIAKFQLKDGCLIGSTLHAGLTGEFWVYPAQLTAQPAEDGAVNCKAVRAIKNARTREPSEFRWCSPCGKLLADGDPCAAIAQDTQG